MKRIYIFFAFILLGCYYFYGCIDFCNESHFYRFNVPLTITPNSKIFSIGDTLNVVMDIDNSSIYDSAGKRKVNFPNFDPNAFFRLTGIDSIPVKNGLRINKVIVDTSIYDIQIVNNSSLGTGIFFFGIATSEKRSKLEFKVILTNPGLYALDCSSALYDRDHSDKIEFPDRCGSGDIDVIYTFEQGSNHDLLTNYHEEVLKTYWTKLEGERGRTETYFFRVE